MIKRRMLLAGSILVLAWGICGAGESHRIRALANDCQVLFRSPDPQGIYCYDPGLAVCPNGRLIATYALGGKNADTLKPVTGEGRARLYTSDDHGASWDYRTNFSIHHFRSFVAGDRLYVIGHSGNLRIYVSDDWGDTWSEPVDLTQNEAWHGSAMNVWYKGDDVYLAMERHVKGAMDEKGWTVSELAPILLRGNVHDDLMKRKNWTFSSQLVFHDVVDDQSLDYFGVPFFDVYYPESRHISPGRGCSPIGWLETNVVQIEDPKHYWYDPSGKTFHLFMRAHTGGTGYACLAKVVEQEDGSMKTMLETAPSGKKMLFLPLPGGQMRFHVVYDEKTKLYWLLSTQATDSMTRAELLPKDRYNLPNNERRRMQLHFSRNMVDWCFAGLVAVGPVEKASRHYASMIIDGDDLRILSRSGDENAKSAHDGNLVTFHTVKNFRELVY